MVTTRRVWWNVARRRGAMVVPRQWRSALRASREPQCFSALGRLRTRPRGEQRGPAAQPVFRLPLLQRNRVCDRRLAREALTDVDRRLPVDEILPGKEGYLLRRAEGDNRVRLEGLERRPCDRCVDRPDDRDLPRRREVQLERVQRMPEGRRRARETPVDEPEDTDCEPLELVVAVD